MRIKLIVFLLFPLLCCLAFIAYCYVSAVVESNKEYYFPQIETYLRVYKPPFDKYGYMIFSKKNELPFSENIDFVKVRKSETNQISFIFKISESDKFHIVDRWDNATINQVDFIVDKIDRTDTTFFYKECVAGVNTYVLKPQYFEIYVDGFLQSLYYLDYDTEESPIKAEPIKKSVVYHMSHVFIRN